MLDPAIMEFFEDRKSAWLKKNLKASMTDVKIKEKEIEWCYHPILGVYCE